MVVPRRTEWHPQVPAPTPGDRTLYTYAEAARVLRKQPKTLRKWVHDGRIPPHMVTTMGPRSRYFTGDQLCQIIDMFAAGPPPAVVRRRRTAA